MNKTLAKHHEWGAIVLITLYYGAILSLDFIGEPRTFVSEYANTMVTPIFEIATVILAIGVMLTGRHLYLIGNKSKLTSTLFILASASIVAIVTFSTHVGRAKQEDLTGTIHEIAVYTAFGIQVITCLTLTIQHRRHLCAVIINQVTLIATLLLSTVFIMTAYDQNADLALMIVERLLIGIMVAWLLALNIYANKYQLHKKRLLNKTVS